jgi:hypothetical protein
LSKKKKSNPTNPQKNKSLNLLLILINSQLLLINHHNQQYIKIIQHLVLDIIITNIMKKRILDQKIKRSDKYSIQNQIDLQYKNKKNIIFQISMITIITHSNKKIIIINFFSLN